MEPGELWTRWTVRLAVVLYVLALALRIAGRSHRTWQEASRSCWTAGGLAYLGHVACAFAFYHHWSHAAAYEFTALRTHETVGLDTGAGLYANYAFTLVWLLDASWWWLWPRRYETRPRLIEWAVQGFLGFMMFNATVVFASGFSRWFGIAACVLLAFLWWRRA